MITHINGEATLNNVPGSRDEQLKKYASWINGSDKAFTWTNSDGEGTVWNRDHVIFVRIKEEQ